MTDFDPKVLSISRAYRLIRQTPERMGGQVHSQPD